MPQPRSGADNEDVTIFQVLEDCAPPISSIYWKIELCPLYKTRTVQNLKTSASKSTCTNNTLHIKITLHPVTITGKCS